MSEYKTIFGKAVKALASDPTDAGAEGQVWYNSTDGAFKTVLATGAWISTSPLNTARESAGGAGIQTAAMVFGGRNEVDGPPTGGPNAQYNLNEEYNGTGYSTGGALVQGRQNLSGAGTQTAGLGVGGYHPPAPGPKSLVEEYDGSTWSEVNNIPTGTFAMGSAGTQTAAVVTGGRTAGGWVASTYEYDGTNWTSGGALGTARTLKGAMTGTLTAALAVGGDLNPPGGATNKVEEYNGTAWTEVNSYPTNINVNMVSGIQTSALSFGGSIPPYTTNAFTYDGTNFTATGSMGSSVSGQNTLKTATNNSTGLSMGGYGTSSYIATSEEYNFSVNVITAAAWSSGGNLNTARTYTHGCGLQDAALIVAGYTGTFVTNVEEYNGTSWSEQNDLGTARYNCGTFGIQTAAIAAGGRTPPPDSGSTTVEGYDGSSWTALPSLNSARTYLSGVGTNTAGLVAMGANPRSTASNLVEEYDGSSWTSVNTNITTRSKAAAGGVQTSATYFGGQPNSSSTEEYDGTNWTTGGNLLVASPSGMLASSTNSAGYSVLRFAGNPSTAVTEAYNGTAWSTRPSLSTARHALAGAGIETAALAAGGGNPYTAATEEFTEETTALNLKTITTS